MSDETGATEPGAEEPETSESGTDAPAADAPASAVPETTDEAAANAPETTEGESTEGESSEIAVRDEAAVPAVASAVATEDPIVEARRSRLWLPFLIPLGAILAVAFFALNISRVFLAASEGGKTPAIVIAIGITVAILVGATVIAALPEIRTSSLVLGVAGITVVVLLAGSLVLGASLPKTEASAEYVGPSGPAVNTLSVEAFPELKFQAKEFNVPAGINLIKYVDKGGTHTLVFDGTEVPGFQLAVPVGKNAAKVDLKQGKTYTIYCTLPGHRQAGMEATINVGPPAKAPEPGTQTPTTTLVPGTPTTTAPGNAPGSPASQSSTGGT